MGDDGISIEDFGAGFIVMVFAIFLIFEHSFPKSEAYVLMFSLISLLAVFLILKGIWNIAIKKEGKTFLMGVALSMVLILLFDGLNSIIAGFTLVLIIVEELIGIITTL